MHLLTSTTVITLHRGSLQALCERAVATRHVEPRTALEVLHYADAAGAGALKRCSILILATACSEIASRTGALVVWRIAQPCKHRMLSHAPL